MSDRLNNQDYIVNGFRFEDYNDYLDALNEKKGIKYLDEQIDLNDTAKLLKMYKELHEKKVFRTQIGIEYMRKIRSTLRHQIGSDDGIPFVEIAASGRNEASKEPVPSQTPSAKTSLKDAKLTAENTKLKKQRRTSIIINIILAVVIIVMFIIASTTSNANVINYERKLQDKYSTWQTQLNEKELQLNQKERELNEKAKELGGGF